MPDRKESICLPCHVSVQCKWKRGKIGGKLELICVLHNFPCHKKSGGKGSEPPSSGKTICPITYKLKMWNVSISVGPTSRFLGLPHPTQKQSTELHFNFDCGSPSPLEAPPHTIHYPSVYVNSFAVTLLWRPISLIYANTARATDSAWRKYKSTDAEGHHMVAIIDNWVIG